MSLCTTKWSPWTALPFSCLQVDNILTVHWWYMWSCSTNNACSYSTAVLAKHIETYIKLIQCYIHILFVTLSYICTISNYWVLTLISKIHEFMLCDHDKVAKTVLISFENFLPFISDLRKENKGKHHRAMGTFILTIIL